MIFVFKDIDRCPVCLSDKFMCWCLLSMCALRCAADEEVGVEHARFRPFAHGAAVWAVEAKREETTSGSTCNLTFKSLSCKDALSLYLCCLINSTLAAAVLPMSKTFSVSFYRLVYNVCQVCSLPIPGIQILKLRRMLQLVLSKAQRRKLVGECLILK